MTSSFATLIGFSIFLIVASFINLLRIDYWWVRIWDFPHLQLAVLTVACLGIWFVLGKSISWPLVLIPIGLLAAASYQTWLIFPYTPLHSWQMQPVKEYESGRSDAHELRLLTANVFMENKNTKDLLNIIEENDPDVVLLLETDTLWQNAMKPLLGKYPYQIAEPLSNTYGMLMYSRLRMKDQQVRFLIEDDIPSISVRLQLAADQWIQFYGVHPMPPSPTEHYRSTERDAELLLVGKESRQQTVPTVVAGDLNDVAWSHTTRLFQRVSGLLDPRVGRGLFSTFHAKYPFLRWPLDHVFASTHFHLKTLKRLRGFGSDHFPILAVLACEPQPQADAKEPEPEHDDLHETQDIINRAEN